MPIILLETSQMILRVSPSAMNWRRRLKQPQEHNFWSESGFLESFRVTRSSNLSQNLWKLARNLYYSIWDIINNHFTSPMAINGYRELKQTQNYNFSLDLGSLGSIRAGKWSKVSQKWMKKARNPHNPNWDISNDPYSIPIDYELLEKVEKGTPTWCLIRFRVFRIY